MHQYHYVGTGDTEEFNCISKCIYTRVGEPSSRYCFQAGDEEVFCQDNSNGESVYEGGQGGSGGGSAGGSDGGSSRK